MSAVPGYPNLRYTGGATKPAEQHVNPSVLSGLQRLAAAAGVIVDIFSGSGGPSVRGAGFAGDPHDRAIAVDAQVNGKPAGAFFTPAQLSSVGLLSGNTPGFYKGAPDPAHIQLSTASSTGAGSPVSTLDGFFSLVLHDLHLPDNNATRAFLLGWSQVEGTAAKNNPLATTLKLPGSVPLPGNPDGVQQYATPEQGAQATASTLKSYTGIVGALRTGSPVVGGMTPQLVHDFTVWSGNANNPTAGQAYARKVFLAAQGNPKGHTAADIGSFDLNNAGDAVKNAADAAVAPLKAVADFLGKLTSRDFLIRAGEVLGGAVLVLIGVTLLARQIGLAQAAPLPSSSVPDTFKQAPGVAAAAVAE